jgi:hypothetical protein
MAEESVGPARSAEDLFNPEGAKQKAPDFLDRPQRANDPAALKEKALTDKQRELQSENDLRAVLSTDEGVRMVARIIGGPCGWNLPYFHASNSVMCEVAGRRSIARQLEEWISNCDLQLWFAVRTELERERPKPKTSEKKGRAP